MVAWSMTVLFEALAEVNECLWSQVEDSRPKRWTSVGYVKVLCHSVEGTVLSPSCICTLVRVSRQKMTLCGAWQEIAVSRDSKSVVRNTNSSRPL